MHCPSSLTRQYPQLYNAYICPVFAICIWLLIARNYIDQAYATKFDELWTAAQSAYTDKKRQNVPTKKEISLLTLRSLYLFPHITASGSLDFTAPMKSDTARRYLVEVKGDAGFSERQFTWHGIVSDQLLVCAHTCIFRTSTHCIFTGAACHLFLGL